MAKHDKATPNPESPLGAAMASAFRSRRPEPPEFSSAADERAWFREQDRRERERAEAARKYPPGSKLFVTTARGIARRGRAGVQFTDKGRTTVEVVDLDDDTIARIRRLTQDELERLHKGEHVDDAEGIDAALATRIRGGEPLASPTGAMAIANDDGLVVLESGKVPSSAELDARDREIAELKAANARLQSDLAAARRGSAAGEGGPERLARDKAKASTPASETFGGDDTGKAKS